MVIFVTECLHSNHCLILFELCYVKALSMSEALFSRLMRKLTVLLKECEHSNFLKLRVDLGSSSLTQIAEKDALLLS